MICRLFHLSFNMALIKSLVGLEKTWDNFVFLCIMCINFFTWLLREESLYYTGRNMADEWNRKVSIFFLTNYLCTKFHDNRQRKSSVITGSQFCRWTLLTHHYRNQNSSWMSKIVAYKIFTSKSSHFIGFMTRQKQSM